jgi:hypothetical protein
MKGVDPVSLTAALPQAPLLHRSGFGARSHRGADTQKNLRSERTSQTIFGERQYLLRVLDTVENSRMPAAQQRREQQSLHRLIHARTQELNRMNPDWDNKVAVVLRPDVRPEELDRLAREAPPEDYFLLRLISEHPQTSAATLTWLARNGSWTIRENVARHPNADPDTLLDLCRDRAQPLWYLVAYNPAAPASLRRRLTRQMNQVRRKRQPK